MHHSLFATLSAALLVTHAHASLSMQGEKLIAYGEEVVQTVLNATTSDGGSSLAGAPTSILLKGGTVIAFNTESESLEILRDTSVLVVEDRIAGLYGPSDSISLPDGTEVVECFGQIVSPGFVDTHRHGWQTAFKTLGSNSSLPDYFIRYGAFTATQFEFTPEDVYIGTLAGNYEAINAGVTSILDHAHHTWSHETATAGLDASIDSGLRIFWAYDIHTISNGFTIPDQLVSLKKIWDDGKWKGTATTVGMGFDEPSLHPKETVESVFNLAKEIEASVFTVHYLGGPWGVDGLPQLLHSYGFLNGSVPIVFSHASWMSTTDIVLLRETNQFISITPESEMHYGHDHPYSHLIQDQAALGVDTHFTFSTDIVGQARLWLQKTRLTEYSKVLKKFEVAVNSPMSVNQAFLLATRNGGRALRRDDIGVIRVGAKADLVVFDGESPSMLGWKDPVAAVILHSHPSDVLHVLVDGQFRKRDGKFVIGDWAAIKKRFMKSCERIQEVWGKMEFPERFEGQVRGAGVGVKGPTVDVVRGAGTGY
ncbi:amidohydrolase [Exidia glandulosa HHB12029]|uniref:Amidohydrolase n=1 Tax=Exidia glandulosa HHB12029 TaxID=1314781 RepID=A0A166BIZ5_EXIGL|nr:amidohydrolase [Exidia glandulosa HHB12029]